MSEPLHQRQAREPEIKAEILNYLLGNGDIDSESTLFNELTIDGYSRRVDLAVLSEGKLIAFEVKSSADTLNRLGGQLSKYLNFFDKVIVVSTQKHLAKISESVPDGVGIWEFSSDRIKVLKKGRSRKISNKSNLLKMMKINELRAASRKFKIQINAENRHQIEDELQKVSSARLREVALQALSKRFSESSQLFWSKVSTQGVHTADLSLLSRYSFQRSSTDESKQRWLDWLSSIEEDPYLHQISKLHPENMFGEVPRDIQKQLDD